MFGTKMGIRLSVKSMVKQSGMCYNIDINMLTINLASMAMLVIINITSFTPIGYNKRCVH